MGGGMSEFYLPFPPSQNHIWKKTPTGMRISKGYEDWQLLAGHALNRQKPSKIAGAYKLTIQASRPDKRRRDLDNIAFKAINDLLVKHGVVEDDSLCEMLSARWVSSGEGVCVRVEPAAVEDSWQPVGRVVNRVIGNIQKMTSTNGTDTLG